MTRTRVLAATVMLAVVIVGVIVLTRGGDTTDDPRADSPVVATGPELAIGDRTGAYRIVYRLEDLSDDDVVPSTDEVWVRPPFESRLVTSTGTVQIAAVDRMRVGSEEEPLVFARVPGLAVSDVRVAPILDAAVDAGLLELREQREVLGRRCQVVRTGTLLGAGPLVAATADEHADSCIDADGLLLEEVLFSGGEPKLRRVATEVDLDPRLDDDLFAPGDIVLAADKGGGAALPVDPASGDVGPFWVLPDNEPPRGFTRVARLSIVPPQPERFASNDPATVAGTADVLRRGTDFIVIYQGGTVGRVDAFAPAPDARPVDGGALGHGELLLSALGTELRFPQPRGRFVHVIGSLPPDELVQIARSLTETEGTGLVYLDR